MSAARSLFPNGLRQFAQKCSARVLSAPGWSWLHSRITGRRHAILTFHRIRDDGQPLDRFDTCPSHTISQFANTIEQLVREYEVVGLSELADRCECPRSLAAITFDDGWRDTFDLAFPYLEKKGIPATLFVTTGKIAQRCPFWQQRLGELFRAASEKDSGELPRRLRDVFGIRKKDLVSDKTFRQTVSRLKTEGKSPDEIIEKGFSEFAKRDFGFRCFVDEAEIAAMSRSCISIGSHTCTHPLLDQLPEQEIRSELVNSKKHLESLIQRTVDMIAYPNGNFNEQVRKIARDVGYSLGCTTIDRKCNRADNRMSLPRIEPAWFVRQSAGLR